VSRLFFNSQNPSKKAARHINEAHHREDLAARRRELFGDAPRSVRSTMIFDVEAPDL
jgi:hypothetical protein